MLKLHNNSNNKLIFLVSFILTLINIIRTFSDETKIGKILIKDGNYQLKEYTILSSNKNNPRTDTKSKICVISSIEEYENFCKPFIKIYYDKWVKNLF